MFFSDQFLLKILEFLKTFVYHIGFAISSFPNLTADS